MNPEPDVYEFFSRLDSTIADLSEVAATMLVLKKDNSIYRANTTNGMRQDLLEHFIQPVANFMRYGPEEGMQILEYDPQHFPETTVLWMLDAIDVPALDEISPQINAGIESLPVYEDETGEMDSVVAMALHVQAESGDVTVFQKLNQSGILKQSKRLSIFFSGENFGKVDYPATFQISKDNCAFIYQSKAYILNPGSFEYIFGYKTKKIEIAEIKLNHIETTYSGTIQLAEGINLAALLTGDTHAINKLQKLEGNISLNPEALNRLRDEYQLDIDIDDESGKMIISTKKDAKNLINILNDDYLMSSLTTGKYNVQSKRRV